MWCFACMCVCVRACVRVREGSEWGWGGVQSALSRVCGGYKRTKLRLLPVKLKTGRGTGMGTFTPTCPIFTPCTKAWDAAPLEVKIAPPFPQGLAFITLMASSRESASMSAITGPKISSRYATFFTASAAPPRCKIVGLGARGWYVCVCVCAWIEEKTSCCCCCCCFC